MQITLSSSLFSLTCPYASQSSSYRRSVSTLRLVVINCHWLVWPERCQAQAPLDIRAWTRNVCVLSSAELVPWFKRCGQLHLIYCWQLMIQVQPQKQRLMSGEGGEDGGEVRKHLTGGAAEWPVIGHKPLPAPRGGGVTRDPLCKSGLHFIVSLMF